MLEGKLDSLVGYFISEGGIPVKIVTTTNWPQFTISVIVALISSLFVFIILGKPIIIKLKIKIYSRKIRRIYKKQKKHYIIVKHSSPKGLFDNVDVMIDRDMHEEVVKLIRSFNGEPFDLYLHTPGGEIFATQAISRILENYPGKVRAVIPLYSMSGGTLLALSCDEIVMGETSVVGPVDPQIGNILKFGSAKTWKEVVKLKGKKAEDSSITFSIMGEQYTKTIKNIIKKLLKRKIKNEKKREKLADFLTSGNVEHGYPILKKDLKKFGLKVKDLEGETLKVCDLMFKSNLDGVYGN